MQPTKNTSALCVSLTLASLLGAACAEPLDTTRVVRPRLSFGGEVYAELCNRVASGVDPYDVSGERVRSVCRDGAVPDGTFAPAVHALSARRQSLVRIIDHLVPPERTAALGDLVVASLELFDDGTIPAQLRGTGVLLGSLADNPAALASLEKLGRRAGYRPLRVGSGLVKPLLGYGRLDALVDTLIASVTPNGSARAPFRDLLVVGGATLAATSPGPAEPTSLRHLLLREAASFGDGTPRYVARRDLRGVVEPNAAAGALPAPFADRDLDGLADVDGVGRFLGADGRPLGVATPFKIRSEASGTPRDNATRLLAPNGELVYRYIDASQTLLAGLVRETGSLLQRDGGILLDLTLPARHLLGTRSLRTASIGGRTVSYEGYDPSTSPLLDLAHAAGSVAAAPVTYWALRLVEDALQKHETALVKSLDLVQKLADDRDALGLSAAQLEPDNTVVDDLLRLGTDLASEPGLLEDLLNALRDPRAEALGPFFADFMRHRDFISFNPYDPNGPALGRPQTPVDWHAPDTLAGRSIFQRFLHLIHDTSGARLCNKEGAVLDLGIVKYPFFGSYHECELFEIDDMTVFYMRAILGTAELTFKDPLIDFTADFDWLLATLTGIDGFGRRPTPAAINRMIFAPRNAFLQNLIDPPLAWDGGSLEARHAGVIFAWEAPGFFAAFTPLLEAFAAHGREDLFARVMMVLHRHWPEPGAELSQRTNPQAPGYAFQSGMRRFEPLIAKALDERQALSLAADLLRAIGATRLPAAAGEVGGDAVVVDLVRQLLLPAWNPGLVTRDGDAQVLAGDGVTPVTPLAPAWLFLDALRQLDDRLAAHPDDRATFDGALALVREQFLAVDRLGGDAWLKNRRLQTAGVMLAGWSADRLVDHWAAGDIDTWAAGTVERSRELLSEPLIGTGVRLLEAMSQHPATRSEIEALLAYVVASSDAEVFDAVLSCAVDTLQLLDDEATLAPLLKALAPALEPDTGMVDRSMGLLRSMRSRDRDGLLSALLRALVRSPDGPDGEIALEGIADALVEVNRRVPGAGGPLEAADYQLVLRRLRDTLGDSRRGAERLFELIENR